MRRFGRISLAAVVLAGGVLGAALLRTSDPPAQRAPRPRPSIDERAVVHAEAAEAHLLDRVEPVGLGADAASLTPIGAAANSASAPAASPQPGLGQFVSWATGSPGPDADLPTELTRPYPEAIEPEGRVQSVSHAPGGDAGPAATTTLFHEVRDGDTLAQLAQRYLGHSDRYAEIFETNRDLLTHPDVLPLGAKLKIVVARHTSPAAAPRTDRLVPLGP